MKLFHRLLKLREMRLLLLLIPQVIMLQWNRFNASHKRFLDAILSNVLGVSEFSMDGISPAMVPFPSDI